MSQVIKKYIEGIGRRKTSVARVRIIESSKNQFVINEKSLSEYFPIKEHQNVAEAPFKNIASKQKFDVNVHVSGGGISSQAESIRLGLSRALVIFSPEERGSLKKLGFLKRDGRAKERRKFGLKKARKSPQWSKR